MVKTLVTLEQNRSHQLTKSFILSPATTQYTSRLKRIGVRSSFLRLPWSSGIILYIGNLFVNRCDSNISTSIHLRMRFNID